MQFEEKEISTENRERLWRRIQKDVKQGNHRFIRYAVTAAASIALLATTLWLLQNNDTDKGKNIAEDADKLLETIAMSRDTLVSSKEVRLVLADNSHLDIKTEQATIQYDKDGQLTVNSSDVIRQAASNTADGKVAYNTIIVPWGRKVSVQFNDGSKLCLNAGSLAVFPVEFTGKSREVYVEGEAYFEVARDERKPFIVKTNDMKVKVLGTKFNVNAYPNESSYSVTLVAGAVEVTPKDNRLIKLTPNQSVSIYKESLKQELKIVDAYDYICWTEGFLKFNSETLSSILRKIERHYNVKIEKDTDIKEYLITGKLDMKEDISDVLKVIEKITHVRSEYIQNLIIIHPNIN
jgi:hypothetical protein